MSYCIIVKQKNDSAQALSRYGIRQRPTLPGRLQPSTIGTEGLNFCVRYGNRCDPFVITTGKGDLISATSIFTRPPWSGALARFG